MYVPKCSPSLRRTHRARSESSSFVLKQCTRNSLPPASDTQKALNRGSGSRAVGIGPLGGRVLCPKPLEMQEFVWPLKRQTWGAPTTEPYRHQSNPQIQSSYHCLLCPLDVPSLWHFRVATWSLALSIFVKGSFLLAGGELIGLQLSFVCLWSMRRSDARSIVSKTVNCKQKALTSQLVSTNAPTALRWAKELPKLTASRDFQYQRGASNCKQRSCISFSQRSSPVRG